MCFSSAQTIWGPAPLLRVPFAKTDRVLPKHSEPAWHRRARRERAQARVLLRVAAATRLLSNHHSSMPNWKNNQWKCCAPGPSTPKGHPTLCGTVNYGWRHSCRTCEVAWNAETQLNGKRAAKAAKEAKQKQKAPP